MTKEELFKLEERALREQIAESLRESADDIEFGGLTLGDDSEEPEELDIIIPQTVQLEIELERQINGDDDNRHYELIYKLSWIE